mmetsp:Transcript_46914/g.124094  ORF Transcript_46914/g.124094 Transcript_46914/m.124094 type:complete len:333 (+) Transcript_46914:2293-3291(+)
MMLTPAGRAAATACESGRATTLATAFAGGGGGLFEASTMTRGAAGGSSDTSTDSGTEPTISFTSSTTRSPASLSLSVWASSANRRDSSDTRAHAVSESPWTSPDRPRAVEDVSMCKFFSSCETCSTTVSSKQESHKTVEEQHGFGQANSRAMGISCKQVSHCPLPSFSSRYNPGSPQLRHTAGSDCTTWCQAVFRPLSCVCTHFVHKCTQHSSHQPTAHSDSSTRQRPQGQAVASNPVSICTASCFATAVRREATSEDSLVIVSRASPREWVALLSCSCKDSLLACRSWLRSRCSSNSCWARHRAGNPCSIGIGSVPRQKKARPKPSLAGRL